MKISSQKFFQSLHQLDKIKILVIGDLILDEYLFGEVNRISPEAPVPIVVVKNTNITLGGAGNVVKNLRALGVETFVYGRLGNDDNAERAIQLLKDNGLSENHFFLLKNSNMPTIIKTRIIASHQQICRVDRESIKPLEPENEVIILNNLNQIIQKVDGIILSDYDKGTLTPNLISNIIQLANKNNKFITADPQVSHFFSYQGISLMTPNHHEAGSALGRKLLENKDVEQANEEICERLNAREMMITRGEKGLSIFSQKNKIHHHISTVAKQVYDVTGAGDTVISVFTSFRAAGLDILDAAIAANAAAGVVVEKLGAETVNRTELGKSLMTAGYLDENS